MAGDTPQIQDILTLFGDAAESGAGASVSDQAQHPLLLIRLDKRQPVSASQAMAAFAISAEERSAITRGLESQPMVAAHVCASGIVFCSAASNGDPVLAWLSDTSLAAIIANVASSPLTSAETRLLKQMLCGLSLAECARTDGVGHETKRSQFKTLSAKMGLRTQQEVLIAVFTRLQNQRVSSEPGPKGDIAVEVHPLARHLTIPDEKKGMPFRFLDYGPPDGRPIVLFPSQIAVPKDRDDIAFLRDNKLRMLIVLRPGSLGSTASSEGPQDHLDHSLEAFRALADVLSLSPVDVVGAASGSHFAVHVARNEPRRVRSISLFAADPSGLSGKSRAVGFRAAATRLAGGNAIVTRALFRYLEHRLTDHEAAMRFFRRLYEGSAPDLAVLEGEFAKPRDAQFFIRSFHSSRPSVENDFRVVAAARADDFLKLPQPKQIIVGADDRLVNHDRLEAFCEENGIGFTVLADAGQLLVGPHLQRTLQCHSNWLTGILADE